MGKFNSQFVAKYSDSLATDVNEDLFDRRKGKQIWEFIVDDLRSIEVIPNVRLTNIEYVTDMSKLDVRLNRRNIKSRFILHNKIEKLIPINPTIFDALKFTIVIGSQSVDNTILIPKYIDRYHFFIEGNKTLPMFQIVDNATYNQKGNIILKTRVSAKLSKEKRKLPIVETEGKEEFNVNFIYIDLFKKKFNPLFYYAANKGIVDTIEYFGYTKFLNVVNKITMPDIFYYFKINSSIYIEAEKSLFTNDKFFKTFVAMFIDLFNTRNKFEDIMNQDFWIKKLGSHFTSSAKNQYNKGLDVLKSFRNVLDPATQNTLRIPDRDKFDTYAVFRYIMREFNSIRNADNNNLNSCRVRVNEYIASYFGMLIKKNLKYALNMRPFDEVKCTKIFKFDEYSLLRMLSGNTRGSSLFRYNIDINDLQAMNGLKYSFIGIGGLPSDDRVTDEQRDIYPSHLGKLDLNSFSSSSPGTSGMLTPFCQIHENGYFGELDDIGKTYSAKLKKKIKNLKEEELYAALDAHYKTLVPIYQKLEHIVTYSKVRNDNGYIQITKTNYTRNDRGFVGVRTKVKYLSYRRGENGYIQIFMKTGRPKLVKRDAPITPQISPKRRKNSK